MPRSLPPVLPEGTLRRQPQPTLTTEGGTVLRPWRSGDEAALVAAYDDPHIRFWHHRTMTRTEAADWIRATSRRWEDETDAEWAVVHDDELVGRAALRDVDLSVGQAELSYWIRPHARGRGLASDAVRTVADWALDAVGFWRLEIRHAVGNTASCGVAHRSGFVDEAVLRRAQLHEDGWHDVHVHRRLREEPSTSRPDDHPSAGRAVDVRVEHDVDRDELLALYGSVGWEAYTRAPDMLAAAIASSSLVVTARDVDGELVGLARGLSDDATILYLQDVLVRPSHQRRGIGRQLVTVCLHRYRHVRQKVLLTEGDEAQRRFYASLGYVAASDVADTPLVAYVRFDPPPDR